MKLTSFTVDAERCKKLHLFIKNMTCGKIKMQIILPPFINAS